ncbi:MAG: hypothetical protein J1E34_09810 [Oscillospiraceae bacterium]|nr:hypothetical protein [Oscillospiraceae bacterium]
MKNNRFLLIKIIALGVTLMFMTFFAFIIPLRPTESLTEKRILAEFPEFSFSALFSGEYFSDISAWFSDTVPYRDDLTALNAKLQNLLGTNTAIAGFNEGAKGDDIPDIPPASEPTETSEPDSSGVSPSETESESGSSSEKESESQGESESSTEDEPAGEVLEFSAVLVYENSGYEYYNFVQSASEKYAAAVNRAGDLFAGKARVFDMIIPTSIDITLNKQVRASVSVSDQKKAINYMESLLSDKITKVSIFDTLMQHKDEYIYFRTDHHWTELGAYYAYLKFCEAKGVQGVKLEDCTYKAYDGFLGTFYTDSGSNPALGNTPDTVETYMPKVNAKMTFKDISGNEFTNVNVLYDATTNNAHFKYGTFIWGDNPLSVIENFDMAEGESLLLIKESFGNAIVPLLTYNYKYIYVMDYRYYDSTAAALVENYGIDDVLFCNNISMTRASSQVNLLYNSVG